VLRGDYAVIADMAGGLLKSVAGSALKELLFPSKTIDIDKLLSVIARTGAAGKSEYVDPGLPLFVAAAQIKANRLELRRKLTPANDAAIRAVLITHLEDSLAHARKTMNRRRTEAMNARLGRISECFLGSKDSHAVQRRLAGRRR
jgi:hypothetical protein